MRIYLSLSTLKEPFIDPTYKPLFSSMYPSLELSTDTTQYHNDIFIETPKVGDYLSLYPSLTQLESIFLIYSRNAIHTSVEGEYELTFFETSDEVKDDFRDWAMTTYSKENFSPEELDLAAITSSIWEKTKNLVDNSILKRFDYLVLIENEKEHQKRAAKLSEDYHSQGLEGKMFTIRQMNFLY